MNFEKLINVMILLLGERCIQIFMQTLTNNCKGLVDPKHPLFPPANAHPPQAHHIPWLWTKDLSSYEAPKLAPLFLT